MLVPEQEVAIRFFRPLKPQAAAVANQGVLELGTLVGVQVAEVLLITQQLEQVTLHPLHHLKVKMVARQLHMATVAEAVLEKLVKMELPRRSEAMVVLGQIRQ